MPKTITSHKGMKNGNYKHGGKGTKLYEVWCSMKNRCNCPNTSHYIYYGGRGISVCDEWKSYPAFQKWALDNGYKDGLSIDRINNDGNYEPSNCRWVTQREQANNQRKTLKIEYMGKTKTLHEWAEYLGIQANTLYYRIYKLGWSVERAFNEKVSFNRYERKLQALKERERE